MSKMTEYIDAACGYDSSGLPASTTQFTFGFLPFTMAETEKVEDVTSVVAVCTTDAVVDIKIIDEIVKVVFDFSTEVETLAELATELEAYREQKDHVTEAVNRLMDELDLAERNGDVNAADEVYTQLRSLSIPFMLPTIMPVEYGATVHVGFLDDPKFIFFSSEHLNEQPYQVTMIFAVKDLFCEDEIAVYNEMDMEAEIAAQQEEMWYLEEARKAEEEAYQAQYGQYTDMYSSAQSVEDANKKMKGVRVK